MEQIKEKIKAKLNSYWNWKTKTFVYVILPLVVIMTLLIQWRGAHFYDCVMEEYDVGRETQFALITGSCVIDSGRRTEAGEPIWVKVQRDVAIGDDL